MEKNHRALKAEPRKVVMVMNSSSLVYLDQLLVNGQAKNLTFKKSFQIYLFKSQK